MADGDLRKLVMSSHEERARRLRKLRDEEYARTQGGKSIPLSDFPPDEYRRRLTAAESKFQIWMMRNQPQVASEATVSVTDQPFVFENVVNKNVLGSRKLSTGKITLHPERLYWEEMNSLRPKASTLGHEYAHGLQNESDLLDQPWRIEERQADSLGMGLVGMSTGKQVVSDSVLNDLLMRIRNRKKYRYPSDTSTVED